MFLGKHKYIVSIKTGQYEGSAKCIGNAILRFYAKGQQIPSNRHCIGGGRFKAGSKISISLEVHVPIDDVEQIEVWLERPTNRADVKWFVEYMTIENENRECVKFFPFHRWVTMKHQVSLHTMCTIFSVYSLGKAGVV